MRTYSDVEQNEDRESNSASFTMDVAFALGTKFRIAKSHYVGVRLSYDLNVLSPYAVPDGYDEPNNEKYFMGDFTTGITYRYAFGSKWNK